MHREDSLPDFFPAPVAMEPATAPGMSKSESQLNFDMLIHKLTANEEDVTLTNLEESESDDVVVIENVIHDDHSNVCASSAAWMNKSQLELEREMFREHELMPAQEGTLSKPEESDSDDDVVVIENPKHHGHQHPAAPLAPPPIDSEEHTAYLWNQLELECDAFKARKWGSSSKPENLSPVTQPAKPPQWGTTAHGTGHDVSMAQSEVQTRSGPLTTYSYHGKLEGNTDTTSHFDAEEAKRAKRRKSNRESPKCSRKKLEENTSEIREQVLPSPSHAYSLQKFSTQMAEKLDKQKKGQGMLFVSNPMASSTNVVVPMQPNHNQFFHQQVPTISGSSYPNTLVPIAGNPPINVGGNNAVTSSMQQAASLEHVQEWTDFGTTPIPGWD